MEQLEGKSQTLEVKRLSELPLYIRLSILRWIVQSKSTSTYKGGKEFVADSWINMWYLHFTKRQEQFIHLLTSKSHNLAPKIYINCEFLYFIQRKPQHFSETLHTRGDIWGLPWHVKFCLKYMCVKRGQDPLYYPHIWAEGPNQPEVTY